MSRYFPHSDYPEDQPLPHTVLWTHILYRGFQTGAFLGMPVVAAQTTMSSLFSSDATSRALSALRASALETTGKGAFVGMALMVPATFGRMYGREEIEWQDRSWRILENRGQLETDDWSLAGTALGAAWVARRDAGSVLGRSTRTLRLAGGAGIGSLVGVLGYMGWRYGVHGGKFPAKE